MPRRAWRWRRERPAPGSVLVMDTAPATKLRAIERLGATIVQAPYEECWRTVEQHRSDRMQGQFVHPVRRRPLHQRQRDGRPGDRRGPAGRRRRDRADRRRRAARRRGGGAEGPPPATSRSTRRNRRRPRRWRARLPRAAACRVRRLDVVVRRRRRRPVGARRRCGRCCATTWTARSSSRSTRSAQAMALRRRARARHRRRRRRLRGRRRALPCLHRAEDTARSSRSCPAATSI